MSGSRQVVQGLRENRSQFWLLVLINAFVGGMVGMERSILPQFAGTVFGIESKAAVLSFITAFGITKALANWFAGSLANRFGRRRLLLYGWLPAIPVPFILMYAPSWNWVLFANVLLGASQGLTWSSTVVMKIDLVGERQRGFAMGLNEFAGYLSVGLVAYLTGYVAHRYGMTPYPFLIGIVLSVSGFSLTAFFVRDTRKHVHLEGTASDIPLLRNVFVDTSFRNPRLSAITQAGLVNNLNDGMIWGLLPLLLLSFGYDEADTGVITAVYPTVWGVAQLFTGRLSDLLPKKGLLFWGMLLQGVAILLIPFRSGFAELALLSGLLGVGTALVYPTFLSSIAESTAPVQRAESIGTFRLWRDLGYAFGAVLSGITADFFGIGPAISSVGMVTILSALFLGIRMPRR